MTDPTTRDPAASLRACIDLAAKATPDWNAKRHGVIVGGVHHQYTNGTAQSQIAMFTAPRDDSDATASDEARDANAAAALACVNWTRDDAPALLAEVARQAAEIERLHVQLAGCGVAAMGNTREALERNRLDADAYGYSASYGDCLRAAEREVTERERAEAAEQVAREYREAFAQLARECDGIEGIGSAAIAMRIREILAHHGARTGDDHG